MTTAFETFDDTPSRIAVVLVLMPAIVVVVATIAAPLGLLAAVAATVVIVAGVRLRSRQLITGGAVAMFAGVLLAGVRGGSVLQVTVGAAATVVTWDAAENAVSVAGQLGSRAETRSLLVAHSAVTALVAIGVGLATIVVYLFTRGGEPTTAVALLVVAALLFTWLLDR